jgi:invasion protein IalB
MRVTTLTKITVAAGLALLAAPALAQPMAGSNMPPDQWVADCVPRPQGKDCRVVALIDGGPDNFLGSFLIVSYSVTSRTLAVAADGMGSSATVKVDWHPYQTTTTCGANACTFDPAWSQDLLQLMLAGQTLSVQASLASVSVAGPLKQSLVGFTAAYQRAQALQAAR